MATLYSCANLSMIHHATATSVSLGKPDSGNIVILQHCPLRDPDDHHHEPFQINHQTHTQMEIVKLEAPWIDVHTLVADRSPITPTCDCTVSLGSQLKTSGLRSARQNKSPQSRWPSIHASLSFHIIFRSEERRVGKECRL